MRSGPSLFCDTGLGVAHIRIPDGSMAWFHGDEGFDQNGSYGLLGVGGGMVVEQRQDLSDVNDPGTIVGVSAANGRTVWSRRGSSGQAAVAEGVLLTDFDLPKALHALDVRTGDERWTFRPAGSGGATDCDAATVGGRLYAGCGMETARPALYALTADGGTRWTYRSGTGGYVSPVGASGSTLVVSETVAAQDDTSVRYFAVDDSGTRLKPFALKEPDTSRVAVADGVAYVVRAGGEAAAYRLDDGRRLWKTQLQQDGLSAPALADGVLLYATSTGRTLAVDRRDGTLLWSTPRLAEDNAGDDVEVVRRVWVAGRAVLVATAGPLVAAFDGANPKKQPTS
jgi:outer membrane protein assembly factor BamB